MNKTSKAAATKIANVIRDMAKTAKVKLEDDILLGDFGLTVQLGMGWSRNAKLKAFVRKVENELADEKIEVMFCGYHSGGVAV